MERSGSLIGVLSSFGEAGERTNGSQSCPRFQNGLLAAAVVSLSFCGLRSLFIFGDKALLVTFPSFLVVPSDLTAEERQELENIRRRKQELLADIQVGGASSDACGVTGVLPRASSPGVGS